MERVGSPEELHQLWVCWKKPDTPPNGRNVVLLSFLPPSIEDDLEREFQGKLVRAREASREVRADARSFYIDLVARIGAISDGTGRTLRQALAPPGQASRWWYHSVTFRDCESDPSFHWIIVARTIQAVAARYEAKKIVLVGAPWELAAILRSRFLVEEQGASRGRPGWWPWLRGFASRLRYAVRALQRWVAIRCWTKRPAGPFDIILSGFWDWSVWWNTRTQSLTDRYFGSLPEQLRRQGLRSVGWFAWFDPHTEPGKESRRLKAVLAPLWGNQDVVLLEWFLHPWDIIQAVGDFGPATKFLAVRKQTAFRALFLDAGIDYYPLFVERLLLGFLNAGLSHNSLVALATERACRQYRPKVTLSFLEHFLYARAHYEGVRRAGVEAVRLATQHCSWCHEKTFLFLHPSIEFRGEPDGCAVPHPDSVCAMGTFGQELFMECGYPKDQVLLTGSPRYDHVRLSREASLPRAAMLRAGANGVIHILIVSSLDVELEVDMVEAAWAATRGMEGVKLFLRNHPFSRTEHHPRFALYRDQIELTQGSLPDDLERADLILFTYSTVAEEALLQGKPVWQWLPLEFNGSALSETATIPRFGSVASLRQAILDFRADPCRFLPDKEMRELALVRLFYPGDGGAAERIARECVARLGPADGRIARAE